MLLQQNLKYSNCTLRKPLQLNSNHDIRALESRPLLLLAFWPHNSDLQASRSSRYSTLGWASTSASAWQGAAASTFFVSACCSLFTRPAFPTYL